jgi:hypothetical protein
MSRSPVHFRNVAGTSGAPIDVVIGADKSETFHTIVTESHRRSHGRTATVITMALLRQSAEKSPDTDEALRGQACISMIGIHGEMPAPWCSTYRQSVQALLQQLIARTIPRVFHIKWGFVNEKFINGFRCQSPVSVP